MIDVVLDDAVEEDVVRHTRAERTAARIVGGFVEPGLRQYLHGLRSATCAPLLAGPALPSSAPPSARQLPASRLRPACRRRARQTTGIFVLPAGHVQHQLPDRVGASGAAAPPPAASMPSRIAWSGEPCHGSPSYSRSSWSMMRAISVMVRRFAMVTSASRIDVNQGRGLESVKTGRGSTGRGSRRMDGTRMTRISLYAQHADQSESTACAKESNRRADASQNVSRASRSVIRAIRVPSSRRDPRDPHLVDSSSSAPSASRHFFVSRVPNPCS